MALVKKENRKIHFGSCVGNRAARMLAKPGRNCLYLLQRDLHPLSGRSAQFPSNYPHPFSQKPPVHPPRSPSRGSAARPRRSPRPLGSGSAARPAAHVPIFSSPLEKGKQQSCPMASAADCRPAPQAKAVSSGCSRGEIAGSAPGAAGGRQRAAGPAPPPPPPLRYRQHQPRGPGCRWQPALASVPCDVRGASCPLSPFSPFCARRDGRRQKWAPFGPP